MADSQPHKKIALDLDSVTRNDRPEDYYVMIGGKPVQLLDPVELDFRDLDEISEPEAFTRHCVAKDDREHFRNTDLPTYKFRRLMDNYAEHFRLDEIMGNRRASRS